MYENLKLAAEGESGEKAKRFLEILERYRNMVYIMPIHKLLRAYLKETGYLHYFAAMTGGESRVANVKMLLEKAENYEKTSYFGLFHFIRYMEQLQKYDIDAGEGGSGDEAADAVRIMSIHKSKGLEFPICIVAGLSKKINQQDVNAGLICDMDMGIGMEYRNSKTRVRNTDLRRNVLAEKMRMDNLGEELRILYVAMTRAKEKLIMTGVVKNYEEQVLLYEEIKKEVELKIPFAVLSRSSSFMDFILPTTVKECNCIQTTLWNPWSLGGEKQARELLKQINRIEMEERLRLPMGAKEQEKANVLRRNFTMEYQHQDLHGLYAKISVSELKMKAMEEKDVEAFQMFEEPEVSAYVPEFIEEKGKVTGTTRGNAYHRVMELLDFSHCEDVENVLKNMEKLVEEKRLEANYLPLIRKDKLEKFLSSDLCERMKKAEQNRKLYREQPFVLGLAANRVEEFFPPTEKVLIQGIIDAYFEEEGEIVLVDYKTDAIKEPEDLIERYETQVEYYREALEKLTGRKVKECILYSFALNKAILV